MIDRKRLLLIFGLALFALAGCGPAAEAAPGTAIPATDEPASTAAPTQEAPAAQATETDEAAGIAPTAMQEPGAESATREAVAEAAKLLNVPEDQVRVTGEAERVEWPSAALGCPLPGVEYDEAARPGYSIPLEIGGLWYEAHTDDTGRMVVCDAEGMPLLPELQITPGEIDDASPWMPVD